MRLLLVLTVSMCLFHSQHVTRAGDELEPLLEAQGAQLQQLQETNSQMMEQLRALKQLLASAVPQPALSA